MCHYHGDDIIGYVTKQRGVTIHRKDCRALDNSKIDDARLINVSWDNSTNHKYLVDILIKALDRKNLLQEYIKQLDKLKINLMGVKAIVNKENIAMTSIRIEIKSNEELEKVLMSLKQIEGVFDVQRKKH